MLNSLIQSLKQVPPGSPWTAPPAAVVVAIGLWWGSGPAPLRAETGLAPWVNPQSPALLAELSQQTPMAYGDSDYDNRRPSDRRTDSETAPETDSETAPETDTEIIRRGGPRVNPAPSAVPQPSSVPTMTPAIRDAIIKMEDKWQAEYSSHLQIQPIDQFTNPTQVITTLAQADAATGTHTGFLWVASTNDHISLILTTAQGTSVAHEIPVPQARLRQVVQLFNTGVSDPTSPPNRYLKPAQSLYDWLVAPLEPVLEAEGIDTLIFCMGQGLRSLPLAALHDGNQFLIERYAIVRVPAFVLSDLSYRPLRNTQVLAMGASEFTDQSALPAVPLEINTIVQDLWPGTAVLNQNFTLDNLQRERERQPYSIIHLATHANFQSGDLSQSYIQLWDSRLTLDRIDELNWQDPLVELLVLSACETALGDTEAELGFAGMTVQAGVKSALASLWSVSDVGTLALMTEFYSQLETASSKANSLQEAQLAMIRGEVKVSDGRLSSVSRGTSLETGPDFHPPANFSHPFYWSAFTLIGSPW
ncbi:CHAT domain-containing protein [Prochlorothrix hollandica]|uniref:CHAT domain-containing protein n=1 Tax=Prochlorothrix hollandica TaxID=1223 RepID=UPI003341D771